jgi:hypothetical protein
MPPEEPWEPIVVADCVQSQDAGAMVPQVTLTWNEPAVDRPDTIRAVSQGGAQALETPRHRIDLAVHHNGFGRNFYSSALSTAAFQRFNLPSSSALVNDTEAVVLTGPALFPKLMAFRAEIIQDRDSGRRLRRQVLVLRDLSEGLTYQIRLSSPADGAWREEQESVFLTPVCPGGA